MAKCQQDKYQYFEFQRRLLFRFKCNNWTVTIFKNQNFFLHNTNGVTFARAYHVDADEIFKTIENNGDKVIGMLI